MDTYDRAVHKLITEKWGKEPFEVEEVCRLKANRRTQFRAAAYNEGGYDYFDIILTDFEIDKVIREMKAA